MLQYIDSDYLYMSYNYRPIIIHFKLLTLCTSRRSICTYVDCRACPCRAQSIAEPNQQQLKINYTEAIPAYRLNLAPLLHTELWLQFTGHNRNNTEIPKQFKVVPVVRQTGDRGLAPELIPINEVHRQELHRPN